MGKKGQGEGSIFKHKATGLWCASLRLGVGPDGKPRRWTAYAQKRAEAANLLREAQNRRAQGILVTSRQTVAEYLTWWLENRVRLRRPHTYRGYEVNVRVHIVPHLGKHRLDRLTPQHVQEWVNEVARAGASPRTVEYAVAVLRAALNQAVRWRLLGFNPAALVDKPARETREVPALTPSQARAILAAVRPHRLGHLYVVTMGLGLRQGEALGLRWEDVDLGSGELQVQVELQRHEKMWQLTPLKSRSSVRRLPLPGFVASSLVCQRGMWEADRARLGPRWPGWTLVFLSTHGTPLDGPNVTHQLQRILAANGLPRLRFHDLRHGTATLLGALGVPIRITMAILGHSQIATTAEIYQHVADPSARAAMELLHRALDGPPTDEV